MELLSFWKNEKIIKRRFGSLRKLKAYIMRNQITEFYYRGYHYIVV